jgi:L-asparaginase / beta-aspartyl-peptidase
MPYIIANSTAWPALERGAALVSSPGLDIAEAMIRDIEAEPEVHSVGLGSWPNMAGVLELDASIMHGATLEAGAVCAMKGFLHPISVAREVMKRLPHVLLAGEGAERFAAEIGAERAELLTDTAREAYAKWMDANVPPSLRERWPDVRLADYAYSALDPERVGGTTCILVKDDRGDIVCGVSTSGWAWKYPGRIGDSPIIGAGCYADNRYGAVGCIGTGEMSIRAGTARSVVLYMKQGLSVRDACFEAADDFRSLRGGFRKSVIIHAMDRDGDHFVLSVGHTEPDAYYEWNPAAGAFEERRSTPVPL